MSDATREGLASPVALYELVLLRPHGRRDVRVSQTPPPVDGCFELDHVTWQVVRVDYPLHVLIERRFICQRVSASTSKSAE
jgi:hypothetical protein